MEVNKAIGCSVDYCKFHVEDYCTLNKIKVSKIDDTLEHDKDSTICDSYKEK